MKIISGGQTGVDRGALDAALDLGVDVGGYCPRGRKAEDGRIPEKYSFLQETPGTGYIQRTLWNVRDADATLVLHQGEMGPGTKQTIKMCHGQKKRCLVVDMRDRNSVDTVRAWIKMSPTTILNVAGPRETGSPGVGAVTHAFMMRTIRGL